MMAGGGGSSESKTSAIMAGCDSASRRKKWEDKILYLMFHFNTRILALKPFQAIGDVKRITVPDGCGVPTEVGVPDVTCKLNLHEVCDFPVGMSFFELDNKVCMVGGETITSGKSVEAAISSRPYPSQSFQPSDKVYEFDPWKPPTSRNSFRERIDLRLPAPMPSPMTVKIEGKIYLLCLYGHHIYSKWPTSAIPEMKLCFQVLEKASFSSSSYWRKLPPPPFYENLGFMGFRGPTRPEKMLYVVGHMLYMYGSTRMYSFDTRDEKWVDSEWKEYLQPEITTTLSRCITSRDRGLKKRKTTNMGWQPEEMYRYSVVVHLQPLVWNPEGATVWVSLVNHEGIQSRLQRLPAEALPTPINGIVGGKVIEVPEDEDDDDDDHLSRTFCVVLTTCMDILLLSAVRVSLLSPMVVKISEEDGSQYLAAACTDDDTPRAEFEWEDVFLKVETLENRQYALDAGPRVRAYIFDGFFAR